MPVPTAICHFIEQRLQLTILKIAPVSGGSINQVYSLLTSQGKFLIKINSKKAFPDMFRLESKGLKAIKQTNTIAVPDVILLGDIYNESFLLLEWIETKSRSFADMSLLGEQLSELHRNNDQFFGLSYSNYMGSLVQSNHQHPKWANFFIEERLIPQVKIAADKGFLNAENCKDFERLYANLTNLFDEEDPAFIHGDLWNGNFLISYKGIPHLIDPAITYGNREFDMAMTTLFGGFSEAFYNAYNQSFPMKKGWEQRTDLWNIYPLLIHLNLFGRSYMQSVLSNLKQYL